MAAGILVCGLVAAASVFSFAVRTNRINRQMAVATSLLYDKMEEFNFNSASLTHPIWTKAAGSETVVVAGEQYVRSWQIGPNLPRTLTVIVYVENQAITRRRTELIRATTLVSPTF